MEGLRCALANRHRPGRKLKRSRSGCTTLRSLPTELSHPHEVAWLVAMCSRADGVVLLLLCEAVSCR